MTPRLRPTSTSRRPTPALTLLPLAAGLCLGGPAASAATARTEADALRQAVAQAQPALTGAGFGAIWSCGGAGAELHLHFL